MKKLSFILIIFASEIFARTFNAQTNISIKGAVSGLMGQIDSSLLNRFSMTGNAIYLYAGAVSNPGDLGSANAPMKVIPINQEKCLFSFQVTNLVKGTYTLAINQQADLDRANAVDNLTFSSITQINYTDDSKYMTVNFAPKNRVLKVGTNQTYKKPSEAISASQTGDIIEIESGVYQDDFAVISKSLTLRGVGVTRPQINRVVGTIPNGKGIWTTTGGPVAIENIEISGARVPDQNGAAVRIENDTVICNSYLHNNENGVLGDAKNIRIEYSEIAFNGLTDVGFTHNIYVNADIFTLAYSYVHDAHDPNNTNDTGHNVKTRSRTNYILYNRIMNEDIGTAGDQINIPQGGLTYIVGNVIRESAKSHSNRIILFYDNGNDGAANLSRELFLVNNTIVSDDGEPYLTPGSGTTTHVHNNLLYGAPKIVSGTTQSHNVFSSTPSIFMNKTAYDFHLTSGSPAVNAGVDVSTLPNFPIKIIDEYVHPISSRKRSVDAAIDVGAFEF